MAETPDDPFAICGTTIDGKYKVISVVGDGGFGVVYRGIHLGLDEPIAIKCIKLPASLSEQDRRRFLDNLRDEGKILHRLSKISPGIVQALDLGSFTNLNGVWVPYLVMEWLDGETLERFLKKRHVQQEPPLGVQAAIRLLDPAARALAVAHAQRIAHRDIKPANLFRINVTNGYNFKILDFGIAKELTTCSPLTEALSKTAEAPTIFTPRYGAPEQFNKQRGATGPWTDVFALALILIECAAGQFALQGDDPTQLYIASADPNIRPSLKALGIATKAALDDVIDKALAIQPKDRFADAASFWNALLQATDMDQTLGAIQLTNSDNARNNDDSIQTNTSSLRVSSKRDPMSETPIEYRAFQSHKKSTPVAKNDSNGNINHSSDSESSNGSALFLFLIGTAAIALMGYYLFKKRSPLDPPHATPSSTFAVSISVSTTSSMGSISRSESPKPPSDMVYIPPGTIRIPVGDSEPSVSVERGFFLDKMEVSVRDYQLCMSNRKCSPANRVHLNANHPLLRDFAEAPDAGSEYLETWSHRCNEPAQLSDHPVNCVDYVNARDYCAWKNRRLPTEAEWQLAAQGAEGRAYPWGSDKPDCDKSCYDKNGQCLQPGESVSTCLRGQFSSDQAANGALDMAGNVSEWVAPIVIPNTDSEIQTQTAIVRGGSFLDLTDKLSTSSRTRVDGSTAFVTIGFRCAADVPGQ